MASVQLSGIKKSYEKDHNVISGVDLDIPDGQFVVFVGPSGCGKSTLLRMIAGLEDITEGELSIGGKRCNETAPAERGIAMVFQSYALYPHMSVADNMGFALKLVGMSKPEIAQRVGRAADILQIAHLLERKPKALSGGQRQRVAIGRAIVREPDVFLFDEPLSNLDAALRVQTRIELARLHKELNTTMIYVTHDQVEAMTLGEQIVVFNAGRIEQTGTPLELYEHPGNRFVAGFLGSPQMNFIEAKIASSGPDGAVIRLPDASQVRLVVGADAEMGASVTLGVRPEHIAIVPQSDDTMPATVMLLEHLGDVMIAYVQLTGVTELVSVKIASDGMRPGTGEQVSLSISKSRAHLFNSDGKAFK